MNSKPSWPERCAQPLRARTVHRPGLMSVVQLQRKRAGWDVGYLAHVLGIRV